ncbi:MAG: DeoR/GlpR family DNA-binding transcription regulator [Clostridiales bacterium]|nr:DeoR/GlpR family DNA-binding transcription regulator [Clostridiales bacterium]
MLAQERYQIILEHLGEEGAASVSQLSALLNASEATIRRDLSVLAKEGKLNKVFGGATSIRQMGLVEEHVSLRETLMFEEKDRIAAYAASLIRDDDFVFIDSGTTTACMIPHLKNVKATYVTNGVAHAYRLLRAGFNVYIIGGRLRPATEAVVGAEAMHGLLKYNFTKAFMGTNGISPEKGFTTPDVEEANVKQLAIERSFVAFVLADHTKFNRAFPVTFARADACCILTDRLPKGKFPESTIIKEVDR